MYPYQIERRLIAYVEDDAIVPLIRRTINEAIQLVCNSNEPNRDYSFLRTSAVVAGFTASNRTIALPSDCRVVIDLEDTTKPATLFSVTGDRKLYYSGAAATSQSVTVYYYRQHPAVYLNSYFTGTGSVATPTTIQLAGTGVSVTADAYNNYYLKSGTEYRRITDYSATSVATIESAFTTAPAGAIVVTPYNGMYSFDATWTASDPPESDLLIPVELHELIIWWALDLLYEHEIEVAANRQLLQQRIVASVAEMRANYAVQIMPNLQIAMPTAEWLVAHGCMKVKGEKQRVQMLNMVNNISQDIANGLKLAVADRPAAITAYTTVLPTFKSKAAPAMLWYQAMMFYCSLAISPDQKDVQSDMALYQKALNEFKDEFYAIAVSDITTGTTAPMSTYGDMVAYLRSNIKSYRSEAQLWAVVNKAVGDVMRRIDVNKLIAKYTFNTTPGTSEYTMPGTVKKIIRVTVGGSDVPGRAVTDFRTYLSQAELGGQGYSGTQSYVYYAGKMKLFESATTSSAVVVYYYPQAAFVSTPTTTLPIDPLVIMGYLDARVALAAKDYGTYKALSQDFMQTVQDLYEVQNDNLPQQDSFRSAYPGTNQMLTDMSGDL